MAIDDFVIYSYKLFILRGGRVCVTHMAQPPLQLPLLQLLLQQSVLELQTALFPPQLGAGAGVGAGTGLLVGKRVEAEHVVAAPVLMFFGMPSPWTSIQTIAPLSS